MTKEKPIYRFLATQEKEFANEILSKPLFGDGQMTIEKLRELDNIYNPEDEND